MLNGMRNVAIQSHDLPLFHTDIEYKWERTKVKGELINYLETQGYKIRSIFNQQGDVFLRAKGEFLIFDVKTK